MAALSARLLPGSLQKTGSGSRAAASPLLSAAPLTQRAQYLLTTEYTLNHNLKAPIIEGIFLN